MWTCAENLFCEARKHQNIQFQDNTELAFGASKHTQMGLFPTSQAWVRTERDGEVCAWSSSKASWGPEARAQATASWCWGSHLLLGFGHQMVILFGGKIRPAFLIEKNCGKLPGVLYYSCCVTNYTNFLMGSTFKPPGRFIKESCMPPFYTLNLTLTFL